MLLCSQCLFSCRLIFFLKLILKITLIIVIGILEWKMSVKTWEKEKSHAVLFWEFWLFQMRHLGSWILLRTFNSLNGSAMCHFILKGRPPTLPHSVFNILVDYGQYWIYRTMRRSVLVIEFNKCRKFLKSNNWDIFEKVVVHIVWHFGESHYAPSNAFYWHHVVIFLKILKVFWQIKS